MKLTFAFFFFFMSFQSSVLADAKFAKKADERSKIGPTFSAPILFENNLYFVATTGVLFKISPDLSNPEVLFSGKKQSISSLALSGTQVFWGEGLHQDKTSELRSFDLKTKKLVSEIKVDGHIERGPFIHDNILYTGLGEGGVAAFKLNPLTKIWQTKEANGKALHSDGNILFVDNKVCTTSVYTLKAVVCFDSTNGKVLNTFTLKKSPKSEITSSNSLIIGYATEANLSETKKWDTKADLYVIDLKNNKVAFEKELRGYNFFAPLIVGDLAYVTLSTGDFITVSLKDSSIGYIGEFAEPFINNPFIYKDNLCAIGIMGKFMCYSRNKNGPGIINDSRFMETTIGKISSLGGKFYAPSRMGYYIVE